MARAQLEYEGVRCMSYGFVNPDAGPGAGGRGAAIARGPLVSKLVTQLATGTACLATDESSVILLTLSLHHY